MAIIKTRNEIITQSLRMIGAVAEDENPSASQIQDSSVRLDWMVKQWQSTGAHLWKEREATLFLVKGQKKYLLGGTSTEHVSIDPTETTLSADAASAATVLSLTDAGGAVSDFIGVFLDDGTLFWTTIISLAPLTINDPLPSAAASGNTVFYYTTNISKPLRVPDARRIQSGNEIEMKKMGRITYFNLPTKGTEGVPVQFYYQPSIDDGTMFIWPTAQNADQQIKFTFYQLIDVFDGAADAPDFPNEWVRAISYNLAVEMAPDFGQIVPQTIESKAQKYLTDALEWDDDDADVFFQYSDGTGLA